VLAETAPGTAPGVTGLWPVEGPWSTSAHPSAAVVSFADASRGLVLEAGATLGDGTALLGLADGERTVAFGSVVRSGGGAPGGGWAGVQVTPTRARALAWPAQASEAGTPAPPPPPPADWTPPPGVTIGAAAVFPGGVLVSTSDARGVALLVVVGGPPRHPAPAPAPAPAARLALEAEVSCLHAGGEPLADGSFLALAGTYASSIVLLAARDPASTGWPRSPRPHPGPCPGRGRGPPQRPPPPHAGAGVAAAAKQTPPSPAPARWRAPRRHRRRTCRSRSCCCSRPGRCTP